MAAPHVTTWTTAKPNPQAAALALLVRKYPDKLERLEEVAAG